MPTKLESWRRYVPATAIFLALGVVILLSNRPAVGPNGEVLVGNVDQYTDLLKQTEQESRPLFEKAEIDDLTEEDKAKLNKVAKAFDSLNRFNPTAIGPFIGAGKAYYLAGDLGRAEERLRQCLANREYDKSEMAKFGYAEAKYQLSQVLFERKNYPIAYGLADEAVKAVPNAPNYYVARASAELQMNNVAKAVDDVNAALKLDPNHRGAKRLRLLLKATGH